MFGKPVLKLATDRMPTSWWFLPVSGARQGLGVAGAGHDGTDSAIACAWRAGSGYPR